MTDDQLARIQAGELARGGALGRLEQLDARRARGAPAGGRAGEAARQARAAIADLDARRRAAPSRCSVTSRTGTARVSSSLARADGDGVGVGVGAEHVQRLARRRPVPRPRRCPTVKRVRAGVLAEHGARRDRRSGRDARSRRAVTREEVALARAGEEAQVLRVAACPRPAGRRARASSRTSRLAAARRAGSAGGQARRAQSAAST